MSLVTARSASGTHSSVEHERWQCFACDFKLNPWLAAGCLACGKSWRHKTSWKKWSKRSGKQWQWAADSADPPEVPWKKPASRWDQGPPASLRPRANQLVDKDKHKDPPWSQAAATAQEEPPKEAADIIKAIEVVAPLLGKDHPTVQQLQKQLLALEAERPLPMHVQVGRQQRKLRQLENKIVKLAQKLQSAALVIIEKQDEIVQIDAEIAKAQKEFAEVQSKLVDVATHGRGQALVDLGVPTVGDLGLDKASPGVQQRAADLLDKLRQLVADEDNMLPDEDDFTGGARTPEGAAAPLGSKAPTSAEQVGAAIASAANILARNADRAGANGGQQVPKHEDVQKSEPVALSASASAEVAATLLQHDSQATTIPCAQPSPLTPATQASQTGTLAGRVGRPKTEDREDKQGRDRSRSPKAGFEDSQVHSDDEVCESDEDVDQDPMGLFSEGQEHAGCAPPPKKANLGDRAQEALLRAEATVQAAVAGGRGRRRG